MYNGSCNRTLKTYNRRNGGVASLRAELESFRQKLKKTQERIKALNDAIDHKDKLVSHHYQGKITAELKVNEALSENEALKLVTQQLQEQLQDALMTEQRQNSTSTLTPFTLKEPASLLNVLKEKLPKSKTSLRDVEVILDYLESLQN